MLSKLKRTLKGDKRNFSHFCNTYNLTLDYDLNKGEQRILKAIFEDREYADFFPFYKKSTILDIGAHYGYFSLFAAQNSAQGSHIIAVEPDNANFKMLQKNIASSGYENITTLYYAVGSEDGVSRLYHGRSTNHSILQSYDLLNKDLPYDEVNSVSLEKLFAENKIEQVDFLKMDCEGAEFPILTSTPPHVFERIETISMEFHDLRDPDYSAEALLQILISQGFEIVKYHYERTSMNFNFGKVIGSKLFKRLKG